MVIATSAGRALSTDGENWEIQLLAPRPAAWGSISAPGRDHARYAVWSATEGLARFPRFPATLDNPAATAGDILAAIQAAPAMPFTLVDGYECWLCVAGLPVALICSATSPPASRVVPAWRSLPEDPEARAVEAAVATLHGQMVWFKRAPDGSGTLLDKPDSSLPASAFPATLLAVDVFLPHGTCPLITAYQQRQAARLLMLPLPAAIRTSLEQAATNDAATVAHFHRLYPAQCDPALITRLRVEARLRGA